MTNKDYFILAKRVLRKYAPKLLSDDQCVGEVVSALMTADKKFNGNGNASAYRVYYAKFIIMNMNNKIKRNKRVVNISLDAVETPEQLGVFHENHIHSDTLLLINKYCHPSHIPLIKSYYLENKTIYELAKERDLTPQRISQLLGTAIKNMRKRLYADKREITDFL